ncbi:glycerol-3-phosphate 1-O-acyltransferase PlsY [Iodobacter fluviatilis]|uniref:Glycerol-3-phosphate acyltransferase n=1 Tax=Iodobacter fluviatilis TaxID=537 RepID=A0A377Q6T0_9NEIS|nr:glycerol-3-phosphate 1-O-acyltransferase PlsY [Iodobacter fluviatilis]TCU89173.1 glycerol-3-phosphate acyltransferase PlsY [Iodobacter fluviatilis]STQ90542.1 G3P acyltransferase [Iodobacter fluviatilis]
MTPLILILVSYLIGSLSFAVIVSKASGLADPRSYGSGNPGATNVLRSGNKKAALLTLLGDALKGWLAIVLAQAAARSLGLGPEVIALAAVAVTVGHMWPIFFSFKGGKGVATAAGILLALDWRVGLLTLLLWLVVAKGMKISSLAALLAALLAPVLAWVWLTSSAQIAAVFVISVLLIWRHERNIRDLLTGKEGQIGEQVDKQ